MTGADPNGPAHRLWGGRYTGGPAPSLEGLNRSLGVDWRLWREDVEGSRAWAESLARAGVLTQEEAAVLDAGLLRVADRLEGGIPVDSPDEDIHTLVERLLYEEVGDVAGKLHTGRSRNDQVATDARLWCLRRGAALEEELRSLQRVLVDQAESTVDLLMPAYTHLRRAQPVRVAHWLLAHFWALERDRERWRQALERVAVLPLGSGAIAGCPFPIDRGRLRERLGFASVSPNSMDAVGDRDWVCELVFVAALVAAHLSRLAEDLVLFSTTEFGFVELPEAYTTGSSLMPQKRNPDGLELARGSAARMAGQAAASLNLLKGLASGYQKDLQEDKALLFDAFDTLGALLPVTRETVAGLRFDTEALAAAVGDHELLATDLADELVRRGVPFREAHGIVGELVRRAVEAGRPLLGPDSIAAEYPLLDRDSATLDARASVERRSTEGGTARAAILAQLSAARRACA